ncbi:squalene/phytoene synthase family protein [Chryseobacterium sp. Bi04]|uniref:squalene/phytoene synthase family protein n=1 Tax=Chryseobacterium sp. Bi04 TaxID=2822345 RepID=UPI001DCEE2C7|nr:squalene/phytoene synthase family protein [Chryseobacterium sp. Bi04]CAH0237373.1 All-trans-phytoene synthase/15-cis-phytoene synthase [Chryseobacterium sp. Bi04]
MERKNISETHENFSFDQAETYLKALFPRVSRTFALTVPELPVPLRGVVMNAYLLARALDTIEDDDALTLEQKFDFGKRFVEIVSTNENAEEFAMELTPLLSLHTHEAERELMHNLALVIGIKQTFNDVQQQAIERCIRIMWDGMQKFLKRRSLNGLETLDEMNDYCYHAAGVVGEMLTDLFCDYSDEIAKHNAAMKKLAISFGRGLQTVNILYDHWEDRKDGICWLPRDIYGSELKDLKPENYNEGYKNAQKELISITHKNLREALQYTLLIPDSEAGIRRFCYWTISLSVFALHRIHNRPNFTANAEIKIPRNWVLAMIMITRTFGVKDKVLTGIFNLNSHKLPLLHHPLDKK